MFAKLKKKIETDGGLVPALSDSPGKSKIHRDSGKFLCFAWLMDERLSNTYT